jgi:hypothetical protein
MMVLEMVLEMVLVRQRSILATEAATEVWWYMVAEGRARGSTLQIRTTAQCFVATNGCAKLQMGS